MTFYLGYPHAYSWEGNDWHPGVRKLTPQQGHARSYLINDLRSLMNVYLHR